MNVDIWKRPGAGALWAWLCRLCLGRPDGLSELIEKGDERMLRDVGLTLDSAQSPARRHVTCQARERDALRRLG